MKVLWCDTETTGLKPENSGAFQVAMLFKHGMDKTKVWQRLFFLNPLDEEKGILYHEEAYETHGVKKETIEGYTKAAEVMPKIASFFLEYGKGFNDDGKFEKMFFAGYNPSFDWEHLDALFKRYTEYKMSDFFEPKLLDVLEQVKRATAMGKLNTVNKKLTTVCKSLEIPLVNAHDAMGDIEATRELAVRLQRIGVPLVL